MRLGPGFRLFMPNNWVPRCLCRATVNTVASIASDDAPLINSGKTPNAIRAIEQQKIPSHAYAQVHLIPATRKEPPFGPSLVWPISAIETPPNPY